MITTDADLKQFGTVLASAVGPAVVIDATAAAIVAANAAAAESFDILAGVNLPLVLDSAMPAITRLRKLIDEAPTEADEKLVFWHKGRTLTKICTVTALDDAATDALFLVTFPAVIQPSVASRSDAETLKEIARRIREGPLPSDATPWPAMDAMGTAMATAAPQTPDPGNVPLATVDVARLAHELKTPLTAIAAAAEIMRDQRLGAMGNSRYLDYAADMHDSAQHALALISKLLGHAIADKSDAVSTSPIDLNALVARTVSTLVPLADERGLRLGFDAEMSTVTVPPHATELRQIVINLISNALKFTPAGGDIRVATGRLVTGAPYLIVRDTGRGIDDDTVARVLGGDQPEPSPRDGGGLGLGLPLVVRLVREIGGDIEFDAARDKGTVVLVTFKAAS